MAVAAGQIFSPEVMSKHVWQDVEELWMVTQIRILNDGWQVVENEVSVERREEIKMKVFAFREKFPDFDLLEDSIFGWKIN